MSRTNVAAPSESSFLTDIKTLRERARKHVEGGAMTEDCKANRETVLRLLSGVLATELICVLHYRRHHFMVKDINTGPIAAEFLIHANEEQAHADSVATRIVQLGGEPNFNLKGLSTRNHSGYVEAGGLVDMIEENLVAERIAIDSYLEVIRYVGDRNLTMRHILEQIPAVEEEHADGLSDMLHDQ